jgi:hypothetical protein
VVFVIVTSFVNCVIFQSKMLWNPEDSPEDDCAVRVDLIECRRRTDPITSKMISFGGEKVFRVGLKNYDEYFILFFVEINLNIIGMEVEDVMYGIQGGGTTGPVTMEQMKKENIGGCENLHLFKMLIDLLHKADSRILVVRQCCNPPS